MLVLDGEEAGSVGFFPEVEAGGVPVLADVGEVVGDDGPDDLLNCGVCLGCGGCGEEVVAV